MFHLIVYYVAIKVLAWDPLYTADRGRIAPPACFGTTGSRRMMRRILDF